MTLQDDTPEIYIFTTREKGDLTQRRGNKYRYLSGKRLQPARADTYPPGFSFPGLVHLFPPGDEGGPRAATTQQHNNDTMALPRGPVPPSRPGRLVNPFR